MPLHPITFRYNEITFNLLLSRNDTQRLCYVGFYSFDYLSNNTVTVCPKCEKNCLEAKYTFQITSKKLSTTQMNGIGMENVYLRNRSIVRNFLLVSFTFVETELIQVRELQEYTSLDLYISIGGTLGLFLGFLIVTLFKLVHQILLSISVVFKNNMRT